MAITKPTKPLVFKLGQKIRVKKTGATGKIVAADHATNGIWLTVEFGDKKKSILRKVRPSAVEKV
jgi:hypothetical protein